MSGSNSDGSPTMFLSLGVGYLIGFPTGTQPKEGDRYTISQVICA